jgi:hypothetical protein
MKTTFYRASILLFLLIYLLLFSPTSIKGQKASNEFSFSVGPIFPNSDDMTALPGINFQLDYKLMNKHFGVQVALNGMVNSLDNDLLLKKYNASSMNDNVWPSITMMTKLVGRANFLKNKLLVDFNFGFGVMMTYFASQTYSYAERSDNQVFHIGVAAKNDFPSTFAYGGGVRINYKISKIAVFVGYDITTGNQRFELVSTSYFPIEVTRELTTFRLTYSLINIGVTIII